MFHMTGAFPGFLMHQRILGAQNQHPFLIFEKNELKGAFALLSFLIKTEIPVFFNFARKHLVFWESLCYNNRVYVQPETFCNRCDLLRI